MAHVQPYTTASGKRWRVRYRDAAGREHSRTFNRAKDAELYAAETTRRAQLGNLYTAPRETFGAYADAWLARWRAQRRPSPSAYESVERNLRLHLAPLRGLRIEQITAAAFEDVIAELAAARPRSAQHAYEAGRRILRDAAARGQAVDPTIFELRRPTYEEREPVFLTWPQVEELASWSTEPRLIMVAALTGLRLGELAGLRTEDVDLEAPALTVQRSGYRESERLRTKTRSSVRRVPLSPTATRLLREQLLARPPGAAHVFPAEDGGPWAKRALERRFERAARRAGRPEMHFHDLRHTYVSLAAAAGIGPGEIAALVGHADGGALVMRRYRHLFPGALERAAAQLEASLGDPGAAPVRHSAEARRL
jgi:integrase